MESYSISLMVRGFHVYRDIWDVEEGEILNCIREISNPHDPYAVAVVKNAVTVGHVPRKISALCSLFLRRSGTILYRVAGSRWRSMDLHCTTRWNGNSLHTYFYSRQTLH